MFGGLAKKAGLKEVKDPSVDDLIQEKFNDNGLDITRQDLKRQQYNDRVVFYEYGCEFCHKVLNVVDFVNAQLPRDEKVIEKVDVESNSPKISMYEPEGAPEIYLNGIVVQGVTTEEFTRGFLEGFLKEELMDK